MRCLTFDQKMEKHLKEEIEKYEIKMQNTKIVEEKVNLPKKKGRKPSNCHIKIKRFLDQTGPSPISGYYLKKNKNKKKNKKKNNKNNKKNN